MFFSFSNIQEKIIDKFLIIYKNFKIFNYQKKSAKNA